jgi:hypothetical protein
MKNELDLPGGNRSDDMRTDLLAAHAGQDIRLAVVARLN